MKMLFVFVRCFR